MEASPLVSDQLRWLCRGEHGLAPSQIPAGWDERGPLLTPGLRARAAEKLTDIAAILAASRDDAPVVREAATIAMAWHRDDARIRERLQEMVEHDASPAVRQAANDAADDS
jgi:hypothetical protein